MFRSGFWTRVKFIKDKQGPIIHDLQTKGGFAKRWTMSWWRPESAAVAAGSKPRTKTPSWSWNSEQENVSVACSWHAATTVNLSRQDRRVECIARPSRESLK